MSSTPKNNKPVRRIDISRLVELGQPLHIISLGSRCYTRTFPERFHLYNFKQNQSRMPFDGCLTTYKALCNLINTDFVGFDSSANLRIRGTNIVDIKNRITYNHEYSTDLNSISEQLKLRKSLFLNRLTGSDYIVFFILYNDYPSDLIDIINKKFPLLKYKVFNLDFNIYKDIKPMVETEFCTYVNIPKPSENYVEHSHRETPEGIIFEKNVLIAFMEFLTKITGITYDIEGIFLNRAILV